LVFDDLTWSQKGKMYTGYRNRYRIESSRLQNWDYGSNAMYYVTLCTRDRIDYFGEVVEGQMNLSEIGVIADKYWISMPEHFPFVLLDSYVIMPNHIHGIIIIRKTDSDDNNHHRQQKQQMETRKFRGCYQSIQTYLYHKFQKIESSQQILKIIAIKEALRKK